MKCKAGTITYYKIKFLLWPIIIINIVNLSFIFTGCRLIDSGDPKKKSTVSAQSTTADQTFNSCSYTVQTKGSREFGMDILNTNPSRSFNTNYGSLKAMGGKYQTLHLTWSSIEGAGSGTTSGTFTDPYTALAIYESLAIADGVKLSLTLRPIDATGKTVPSDLSSVRFNDTIIQTRFKKMLAFVLSKIDKNNLVSIMIGNEIDNYNPGADLDFWSDYGSFLYSIRDYVITNYSGLKTGFTATHSGLTDPAKTLAPGSNSVVVMGYYANVSGGVVDVVGVTYYPLTSSLAMKDPSVVSSDFSALVAFTAKPIYIQEVGYATGASASGSDYKQAQFFCEVFKSWDDHRTAIPRLALLRMNDISRTEAEQMAGPYGTSAESFIEYLRTLGIYTYNGAAKNAYTIVTQELSKRGF